MKRNRRWVTAGFLLLATATFSPAQNNGGQTTGEPGKPVKYFHLDFVVKEVEDGHVVNSRNYSTTVNTDPGTRPSIRAGSKVSFPTSGSAYQNFDVGVSIDCRDVQQMGSSLSLGIIAEVTSVIPITPEEAKSRDYYPPVVRQNKWTSPVVIPLRKATTVFSSDDVSSRRKLQLEVTATPML